MECESKIDTGNNRGDWNRLKISLKQYLSNIPGEHEINALHSTAILRTAHKLREVLMWKYKMFVSGNVP